MSEQETRLLRCFASVFPALTADELRTVNAELFGIWDSLSTVTLAAVVQEEFNIEIAPEVVSQLTSFDAFRDYLQRLNSAAE
jgi:acyl carrier protein